MTPDVLHQPDPERKFTHFNKTSQMECKTEQSNHPRIFSIFTAPWNKQFLPEPPPALRLQLPAVPSSTRPFPSRAGPSSPGPLIRAVDQVPFSSWLHQSSSNQFQCCVMLCYFPNLLVFLSYSCLFPFYFRRSFQFLLYPSSKAGFCHTACSAF